MSLGARTRPKRYPRPTTLTPDTRTQGPSLISEGATSVPNYGTRTKVSTFLRCKRRERTGDRGTVPLWGDQTLSSLKTKKTNVQLLESRLEIRGPPERSWETRWFKEETHRS